MSRSSQPDKPYFYFRTWGPDQLAVDYIWPTTSQLFNRGSLPHPQISVMVRGDEVEVWGAKCVTPAEENALSFTHQLRGQTHRPDFRKEPDKPGHCRFRLEVNHLGHRFVLASGAVTVEILTQERRVIVWDYRKLIFHGGAGEVHTYERERLHKPKLSGHAQLRVVRSN